MNKRVIKRLIARYGRLFEPLAVFAILTLFILPIVTVLNLSPKTRSLISRPNSSVLGVADVNGVIISKVGGNHKIVQNEKFISLNQSSFTYTATIKSREDGNYSKPILKVESGLDEEKEISFILKGYEGSSEIGLLYNDTNYILKSSDGTHYTHIMKAEKGIQYIYLNINTSSDVNFDQDLEIQVVTN